jgi:hypothetical protein
MMCALAKGFEPSFGVCVSLIRRRRFDCLCMVALVVSHFGNRFTVPNVPLFVRQ